MVASPVLDPSTSFASRFGPIAPEGTYSFKIAKGKQEYEGTIEVKADPDSPHSAADRAVQQETAMELYHMLGRLAYVAEAIASARDDARERAEGLNEKEKLRKKLEEFADDLDELHKSLMVSEHVQGIPGTKKLREKLVRLYASVSGYMGLPSEAQLQRMAALQEEIEQANGEFEQVIGDKLEDLNKQLQKKELEPIELLTEEEHEKREDN